MKLTIHDVGHGMCVSLTYGDKAILWDCGGKGDNRPSLFLPEMGIKSIDALIVTNYDEDHISDLPDLLSSGIRIDWFVVNGSISWQQLYELKKEAGHNIGNGMKSLLDQLRLSSSSLIMPSNIKKVSHPRYYNQYLTDFECTNNISLVTFPTINGKKFIITGDLEEAGWEKLLEREKFQEELRDVDVFIASHHGRAGGYCEEVFDYCNPEVVVICDGAIKYKTQEGMAEKYAKHATGINFQGEKRSVLSTRKDGDIWWGK